MIDKFIITGEPNISFRENVMEVNGENLNIHDGYNTFDELYAARILLFILLMKNNKEISWKSKKFEKEGWFIGGIDLPEGQLAYLVLDKYWDVLDVKEVEEFSVNLENSSGMIKILDNWIMSL